MTLPLTTLTRAKAACVVGSTTDHDDRIRQLITSVSAMIETYLGRHIEEKSRTGIYDVEPGQQLIFLRGYPVKTVTSYKEDISREFSGSAIDSSNYYTDAGRGAIDFDKYALLWGPGVFQAVYVGGMAPTTIRMTVAGTPSGSYTASEVVTDGTLDGRGTFVSQTASSITFDVTSGTFGVGNTITGATSTRTTVITSITTEPLIHKFSDVVLAAELQIAYMWQRRNVVGTQTLSADGASISLELPSFELLPGVKALLSRHKSYVERNES